MSPEAGASTASRFPTGRTDVPRTLSNTIAVATYQATTAEQMNSQPAVVSAHDAPSPYPMAANVYPAASRVSTAVRAMLAYTAAAAPAHVTAASTMNQ